MHSALLKLGVRVQISTDLLMKDYEIRIKIECMLYQRRLIKQLQKEILESKVIIEKTLLELAIENVKTEFEKTWRKENP